MLLQRRRVPGEVPQGFRGACRGISRCGPQPVVFVEFSRFVRQPGRAGLARQAEFHDRRAEHQRARHADDLALRLLI